MKRRLRSAGIIGATLAVIVPQLAITTTALVLTPAVAQAQAGRMHRATRRRTAVVVHTHDQQQAAAQQQQQPQQQPQQAPPPPPPDGQQMSAADHEDAPRGSMTPTSDGEASATMIARAPPDAVRPVVRGVRPRYG